MRTLLLTLALLAIPVLAALPPRSSDNLKQASTHIVTGKVKAVYTTEEKKSDEMVDRLYVVELTITAAEKGEGLTVGKVLYVKCWRPARRPAGWAGPQGQDVIPEAGKSWRVYLTAAEDGTFSAMTPNGWEAIKS